MQTSLFKLLTNKVCGWSWAEQMLLLSFRVTQLQSNFIVFGKRPGSLQLRLPLTESLTSKQLQCKKKKKKLEEKHLFFMLDWTYRHKEYELTVRYWNRYCVSWFIGTAVTWSLDLSQANSSYHFTICFCFFFSIPSSPRWALKSNISAAKVMDQFRSFWETWFMAVKSVCFDQQGSCCGGMVLPKDLMHVFFILNIPHFKFPTALGLQKPSYLGNTEPLSGRACSKLVWFWCSAPAHLHSFFYQP